jgi:protein-tyrosine-phosphatase
MSDKPIVLFVCVHNAGRSQMAAGYLNHLAGGRIEVRSAGSEPADKINPVTVQAMAEEGIDIAAEQPKILTNEAVRASDVVITMGCGDTCPTISATYNRSSQPKRADCYARTRQLCEITCRQEELGVDREAVHHEIDRPRPPAQAGG